MVVENQIVAIFELESDTEFIPIVSTDAQLADATTITLQQEMVVTTEVVETTVREEDIVVSQASGDTYVSD